jgi:hypothetical protein
MMRITGGNSSSINDYVSHSKVAFKAHKKDRTVAKFSMVTDG